MWERTGPRRTNKDGPTRLLDVISRAQLAPFRVQSDFAREAAPVVAQAASQGYITTKRPDGSFGRDWLITTMGALYIEQMQELLAEQEQQEGEHDD
mgnify:CR=1 FL=1